MLDALTDALSPHGLDLVGVADPARWDAIAPPSRRADALLPGTQAIVVVGNGGRTLWDAFVADLVAHPAHLADEPHPLDAYVRRAVVTADATLGSTPRRWFWAAADAELHLDFRVLAELAGLGGRSRLGLLLNNRVGPWLGLRAACFVAAPLPLHVPSPVDPCAGCPAPCIAACPGDAFVDGRWDVDRCSAFHAASPRCAASCAAREACVAHPEARYSPEQIRYHYDRAGGRAWLRERVGLSEDRFDGVGPHWGTWRAKVRL